MTTSEEKLEVFTEWLEEAGVDTCLKSTYIDGRRGAIAQEMIEEGDSIMRIPKEVLITEDSAKTGDLKEFFAAHSKNPLFEDPLIVVATALVYERFNEHSFWKPFFDIMPGIFSGLSRPDTFDLPLEFNSEEEGLLKFVLDAPSLEARLQTISRLQEVEAVLQRSPPFGTHHNLAGSSCPSLGHLLCSAPLGCLADLVPWFQSWWPCLRSTSGGYA